MSTNARMTAPHGALLVVDLQEKVLAPMRYGDLVVANSARLIKAAGLLGIPVLATEQYPKGLGPTVPAIAELVPHRMEKTEFHCCAAPGLLEQLHGRPIRHVTLVGVEAHVCVAQTALELMEMGFRVQVPADAVGSRNSMDWEFALRRLERAGAVVSTAESTLFEWTETSDHCQFKAISALVKGFAPPPKLKHRERAEPSA